MVSAFSGGSSNGRLWSSWKQFNILQAVACRLTCRSECAGRAKEDWERAVTRTLFAYRIELWTADGESIVEHLAGVEDFQLALAAYRAAVERWPGALHAARGARG